ncbi:uncharacterized protein BXZ73DRAFT_80612 [Epithele typhae]|uniref:uncharacterized protein n=1 Tax=Epithele typhae TaxID=378194 RepID=UPI00200803BC|nr:uncharacterized protein BXZ73DRAFT_80612 [Epithele typhae]KAH9918382.1 hypothetical protein BXZ73DRAFT_80612 [Epithele typhae]
MGSQVILSALRSQWAVVGSISVVCYDYFLTFDREIQYVWRRRITSASAIYIAIRYSSVATIILTLFGFFASSGQSTLVRAFPSPNKYWTPLTPLNWQTCTAITRAFSAVSTVILTSSAVLVLGFANAVPSIVSTLNLSSALLYPTQPWDFLRPSDIEPTCHVDFSQFISFRKKRKPEVYPYDGFFSEWCHILRLLLVLSGSISAMTVLLTCRFILDLFEASAGARFGTAPTIHLSTVPSLRTSRSLAFGHVGGPDTTGHSQGIFDADISWRRPTEDSENVRGNPDDYGFELRVDPGPWRELQLEQQKSNVRSLRSES